MKKKKTILTILIIVLVIILFIFCTKQSIKEENTKNETTTQGQQNIIIEEDKINNIEDNTQENQKEIEEIKQEVGLTGDSNIYEVQTETDGRQIVAVKANIKYKVAFSGMIKQGKPKLEEIDQIFNNNLPKKTGVWIETNSRNKVLNYLNSNYGSKYEINENGYLEISK